MRLNAARFLACAALALVTLCFPGRGDSFLQQDTGGTVCYWANMPVAFVININGSDNMTTSTADDDAVRAAFQHWVDVTTSNMAFSENTNATQRQRTDFDANDIHLCIWDENGFSGMFPPGTSAVGITPSQFSWSGAITDSDILFNGIEYSWSTTGSGNTIDIESVATHEAGHLCGLDHTGIYTSTMYPVTMSNVTRSLSPDDVAAISTTYPASNYATTYGSISGTLTLSTGSACRGAHVTAIQENSDGTGSGVAISSAFTNSTGAFTIKGLVPATYALLAEPLNGPAYPSSFGVSPVDTNWGSRYFGTTNQNTSLFQVTAGQTVNAGSQVVDSANSFNATSLWPVSATQGQTVSLSVSGSGLSSVTNVAITGAGITLNSANGGSQITMNITIAATAPLGMRTITLLDAAGKMTNIVGGLDILNSGGQSLTYPTAGGPPPPPPPPPPPGVLTITTTTLPAGTSGTPYTQNLNAVNGATPYSWSISGGSLPVGLTLNATTGVINGTPTSTGTASFTVQITDSATPQAVDTQALSITIAAPPPGSLAITTIAMPTGTVGTPYSKQLTATGGTLPYVWGIQSGTVPSGLSLNTSTGLVSGTPTSSGSYSVIWKVTDAAGAVDTQSVGWTILGGNPPPPPPPPAPPTVTALSPGTGANAAPVTVTITGTGFTGATSASLLTTPATPLTNLVVVSATSITASVPASAAPGAWQVRVSGPNGSNSTSPNYTVTAAPPPPPPPPTPPTANAGADQTVNPSIVTLSGAASGGTSGMAYTYSWTRTGGAGPSVTLTPSATVASPRFNGLGAGTYTFSLTVAQGTTTSAPDSVTITINNIAPVANAGPDQSIATGSSLVLDGTNSKDANGSTLTYSWAADGANPAGGSLSSATSATPTFTPGAAGIYTYRLTVNDGALASTPDPVQIMVASASVIAPSADAGVDTVVTFGTPAPTVTLSGNESVDPDSQTNLTYTWTKIAGPAIANPTPAALNTKIVTFQPTVSGIYFFRLVVRDAADDNLNSLPDTVKVVVLSPNTPPVAVAAISGTTDANSNGLLDVGDTVTLTGAGSIDPDSGTTLTHSWTQSAGAPFTLTGATTATPSFTPLSSGTYGFDLVVSDGTDTSSPATVIVQVLPAGAASSAGAPVAHARVNGLPAARITAIPNVTSITLSGVTSEDHDGVAAGLTYDWSQVDGPTVAISGATSATATFTPRVSRVYRFRLTVRDGNGLTDDDVVAVIVDTFDAVTNPTGNAVPDAAASAPGTVNLGDSVTLSGAGSSDHASDPDGVANSTSGLLFTWTQIGGAWLTIAGAGSPTATVTPTKVGSYRFRLFVDDGADRSLEQDISFDVVVPPSPIVFPNPEEGGADDLGSPGATDSSAVSAGTGTSGSSGGGGGSCFADTLGARGARPCGGEAPLACIIILLLGVALSLHRRDSSR